MKIVSAHCLPSQDNITITDTSANIAIPYRERTYSRRFEGLFNLLTKSIA